MHIYSIVHSNSSTSGKEKCKEIVMTLRPTNETVYICSLYSFVCKVL